MNSKYCAKYQNLTLFTSVKMFRERIVLRMMSHIWNEYGDLVCKSPFIIQSKYAK